MRYKLPATILGLATVLCVALHAAPAMAGDTNVTCYNPSETVNTGQDGTSSRLTIQCLGGSSAGPITYFAFKISANVTIAQLLQRVFSDQLSQSGDNGISLSSDLSDVSGTSWGCSSSNCRIIDYLIAN